MSDLREQDIGWRIAVTFAVVLAVIGFLALLGYLTGGWEDEKELKFNDSTPPWSQRHAMRLMSAQAQEQGIEIKPIETCIPEESRERVRGLMIDAIDDALHDHIKHLFEVWMKDERGQPSRAGVGVRQGIKAHQLARKAAIAWNPPECHP